MASIRKLLLVTPEFLPQSGGVARYLGDLADFFQTQITVVSVPQHGTSVFDATVVYPVYRLRLFYGWIWPKWLKTFFYIFTRRKTFHYLLVSHLLPFGTVGFLLNFFIKNPYIVFLHGMDYRLGKTTMWKTYLTKKILCKAHLVVANSNALAQEVKEETKISNVLVLYPCIPHVPNVSRLPSRELRPLYFLTVGRLVNRKGHLRVINALSELKRAGRLPKFEYHIVGSGPMEPAIMSLIRERKVEQQVHVHGEVDDDLKCQFYQKADLFIMPVSKDTIDKEGFGIVFLEAASYGIPSISTNINGLNEAIRHNETGYLLETENQPELENAIEFLASHPEKRKSLGEQARKNVQKIFLCSDQFQKLAEYL